jgi:hypothetical protein
MLIVTLIVLLIVEKWVFGMSNKVIVQELKNGQLVITIPRAIAGVKGWKKGTVLEYVEDRYGSMTLQEVRK